MYKHFGRKSTYYAYIPVSGRPFITVFNNNYLNKSIFHFKTNKHYFYKISVCFNNSII